MGFVSGGPRRATAKSSRASDNAKHHALTHTLISGSNYFHKYTQYKCSHSVVRETCWCERVAEHRASLEFPLQNPTHPNQSLHAAGFTSVTNDVVEVRFYGVTRCKPDSQPRTEKRGSDEEATKTKRTRQA